MPKLKNLNKEIKTETLDTALQSEIFPEPESEIKPEIKDKEKSPEETKKEMKGLMQEIEKFLDEKQPPKAEIENSEEKKAKIGEYQEKYLPDYLREKKDFVSSVLTGLWRRLARFEKEGSENVPEEGSFLVVCNHFGGGDTEALAATFKDFDTHFAIGKEIWWEQSPVLKWFFKKLRLIPVEESLANLSEQEKEEALKRQNKYGKKVFRKIIEREKRGGVAMNADFVRAATAALSRKDKNKKGDVVIIFPEGLWLNPQGKMVPREKAEMKQGYRGIELVASQYKKVTGKELKILPTTFIEDAKTGKKKLVISKPVKLSENDTDLNGTDWCMAKIAGKFEGENKDKRGYYKDIAIEEK